MDWSLIAPLVDAFHSHQFGYVALGAFLLLLNLARSWKSDAWYVEKLDSVPRIHALLEMIRAMGIDPVALIGAFVKLLSGAKPKPVASKASDGTVDVVIPSAKKDEAPVSMKLGSALLFVGALSLLGSQSGCSFMQSHEGELVIDGLKLAACVDAELIAGDTDAGQIAAKCGTQLVPDFLALVSDRKAQIAAAKSVGFSEGVHAASSVGACHESK